MIKFFRPLDNRKHWYFLCGPFNAERSYFHHGEGYEFLLSFKNTLLPSLGALGFQYCYSGYFFDTKPYVFCFYLLRIKIYFLKRYSRKGKAVWHLSFCKL